MKPDFVTIYVEGCMSSSGATSGMGGFGGGF